MTDKFIALSKDFYVSPQLSAEDIAAAKALGIKLIISNRPDDEEDDQPTAKTIKATALENDIKFVHIPIDQKGVARAHIDLFKEATDSHEGPILAYCRSGTRSTMLRAFSEARDGKVVSEIVKEAADAGYDLYTITPGLEAVGPSRRR